MFSWSVKFRVIPHYLKKDNSIHNQLNRAAYFHVRIAFRFYIMQIILCCYMVSGINRGWSVLCGIILYVMDKNSVFHLKRGRGEK